MTSREQQYPNLWARTETSLGCPCAIKGGEFIRAEQERYFFGVAEAGIEVAKEGEKGGEACLFVFLGAASTLFFKGGAMGSTPENNQNL